MTEVNMRRFGLKLVLGTALTVLLVASIRHQWNSSVRKHLTRQMASADDSDSDGDEGRGDHEIMEDSYERVDRDDATLEEHSENTNDVVENNVGVPTAELEKNITRSGETGEDATETVRGEEAVGGSTLNGAEEEEEGDSEAEIFLPLSSHEPGNSPQTTKNNDEDVPDYDDDEPSDPNWRATKFADSLYDDEEDGADDGANDEAYDEADDGAGDGAEDEADDGAGDGAEDEADDGAGDGAEDEADDGAGDGAENEADDVNNDTGDEEDNYREDDSPYTVTKDKIDDDNTEQYVPGVEKIDNKDNNNPSLFSWLHMTNYLPFGHNPHNDDKGANEVYYDDDNTSKNKQSDAETSQSPNVNLNASTLTENDLNYNGTQAEKANVPTQRWRENFTSNSNVTNIFQEHENDSQRITQNANNNQLPFNINGIDKANYDDQDDFIPKNFLTEKDETKEDSRIEKQLINSYSPDTSNGTLIGTSNDTPKGTSNDTSNGTPNDTLNIRIYSSNVTNPEVQGGLAMQHLWDKEKESLQVSSPIANKLYDPNDLHNTQQPQQQTQPLLYQKQQVPIFEQLPQQQQMLLKALLPPRMYNELFSQNSEPPYLSQFPAKMQTFNHQRIHRIDQDLDPMGNRETKYKTNGQPQIPASEIFQTNGPISSAMRGLKTEEINLPRDFRTVDNGSNIVYEDYDNDDHLYENSDNKPNADDDNLYNDEISEQGSIYTPIPETAVYDNPRPLSGEQFALFRTRPYTNNFETATSLSRGDVGVKYSEDSRDNGMGGSSQQQTSKSGKGNEDETLSCPRDAALSKLSQPVTAFVAFSDDGTVWVRKILEQLTGIETDSIYNIMAQLKMGNVASVYQMGRKVAIESHIASVKNFERAIVVIKNPFSVDVQHKTFRPSSVDWQKGVLWNRTYSTWLTSSLPLHVMTYEDLVERPLTELMKLTDFLSNPEMTISYKCAMKVALDPPAMIDDTRQIAGMYHDDRRRISQNIDYLLQVAQTTHPHIASRLMSYKVVSGAQE